MKVFIIRDNEGLTHEVLTVDDLFFVKSEIMVTRTGSVHGTTIAYHGPFASEGEAVDSIGNIVTIEDVDKELETD